MSGLSILSARHTGTPCASTLRQQVRGVIHKSPGWPRLEATLHAGKRPSSVDSEQSALTDGDTCTGQNEPRSRHVVKEQCLFRGKDAPPAQFQIIWDVFGRARVDLFRLWKTTLTAQYFLQRARLPCPTNGPAFCSMLSLQSLCYRRYSGKPGNNGTRLF